MAVDVCIRINMNIRAGSDVWELQ